MFPLAYIAGAHILKTRADNFRTNFRIPHPKISKGWLLSSQKEILC